MKPAFAAILPFLITLPASAQDRATVAEVTSIYDGDTFRATIAGWPPIVGERMPVRVKGIDTPELRGKCRAETLKARKAKQATVAALRAARRIELRDIERDKYFRLLATVWLDGRSLGPDLIAAGHAVKWAGRRHDGWCR
jgi:endonuclease YncB( thermonuclease family)